MFGAASPVGLAGHFRCGSGSGVYNRCSCHWPDLGAPGLGHLVDVGCTAHFDIRALAVCTFPTSCSARWWKNRTAAHYSARYSGFFAFLDVPLVFGSIRWWRTQHPQPIVMGGPGAGLDPTMWNVLRFFVAGDAGADDAAFGGSYKLEAMRAISKSCVAKRREREKSG